MVVPILDTFNRIEALLAFNNQKQKELTDYLGLQKGTFTKWRNGENQSYLKYVNGIATFFNVSVDYILGNTDIKNKPAADSDELNLNDNEREALDLFKSLPPDAQTTVLKFLKLTARGDGK